MKIVFFGDSITADGSWESEIFPYLNGAKIFNCGVPADDTNAAILRVYESCLIHNPTHVVMMLGANDNRADFYGENGRMQKSFLDRYRNNLQAAPDKLYNAEASADLIWQRICELGVEE